jgi:hypothetical protein
MAAWQEHYRLAVLKVLSFIPDAKAVVNVELEARTAAGDAREFPLSPPPRPGEARSGEARGSEGRPNESNENAIYRLDPAAQESGLAPARVTVSVSIPRGYYEQLWRQRHAADADEIDRRVPAEEVNALAAEENQKLRAAVAQVIPGCSDPGVAAQRISVNLFERLTPTSEPRTPAWLAKANSPAVVGLGTLVLVILWLAASWLRPKTPPAESPRLNVVDADGVRAAKIQLAQMVESDPQAAAKILRDWLAKAG